MKMRALAALAILLPASCAPQVLGSHGLGENPDIFSTLRIAKELTVTKADGEDVRWGVGGAARLLNVTRYAEVRIKPGQHDLEIYYEFRTASIYNASHTDVRTGGPISISRDFEVGRTYILQGFPEGDKFGPVRLSIVPIADNASPNIQELPKVEKLPNSGVRYTTLGRTVYDTKTKLTWQQTVSSKMYTWAESQTYCASVGMDLGGAGWRLPTLKELETIVDHSQSNPSIDATAFPSTPKDRFWSSSPVARSSLNAWAIFFDSGQAYSFAQSLTGYVRCVR